MSIYDNLNDRQKEAVLNVEGPMLVLAGAGSGKTKVITTRIGHMIKDIGIKPWNILAITFTNKAAKEMKERVEDIDGVDASDVWVSTFHSFCVRILRMEIENLGYNRNFVIYDGNDQKTLVKECLKELNISDKLYPVNSVMGKISSKKNELIEPMQYLKETEDDFRENVYANIYRLYQSKLEKNGALDFDDLIGMTVKLFKTREDILSKYQNRFKYIMVDEYQDTNTAQYTLTRLLAIAHTNLCVVGDDDQSIYSWRSADIKNILNFEHDFDNVKVVKLEQNYRCSQNILNAANEVIKNNISRKSKTLWTDNNEGNKIKYFVSDTEKEEARFITDQIAKSVRGCERIYSDFALLYRTNAQSRVLEEYLVKKGIPYALFGGTRFYERMEIKDVISYLRTVLNPIDDIAVKRIINVPKRGIGNTTIEKVAKIAREENLNFYDVLGRASDYTELKSPATKLKTFHTMIENLRNQMESLGLSMFIEEVLTEVGYVASYENENTIEADGRVENINEFISKAVEFENENEDATLESLLEEISLVADIDGLKEDADTVKLMTIHSAKGLEFPVVFLTGLEDGIFPGYRAMTSENENDMEEERRLCYVAITRAKQELYMTHAVSRLTHGRVQYNRVSRFMDEIPKELIDDSLAPKKKVNKEYASNETKINDFFKKNVYNKVEKPKNIEINYSEGDIVSHMKFGKGTVIKINPAGADYEVTVDFTKVGEKKLMSTFAKLKKV
ncbi:MAG: DNA helicase PcrA [Clostridia bacterium]|jgi:DNA helicase-2/ATP-dependent DNA helicase PcrA|nr:DNA helicase PcrA [Clostridia bacterium]